MVAKGISNFDKVAEGIWTQTKFDTLPKDQQDEITKRTELCLNCPYNSIDAQASKEYFDLFGKHYKSSRNDLHCAMCGCVVKFKVSALSSNCGIEHFNATHPENKQPLKWESYVSK